ncbi:MAG: type II toxin-antitoxin system RelE/ParE family toxin [Nitrospinae bacterium]|nr:type II toxin-antitoxin system RelE/ParE family toxin [Nitrospinota bacterium]
MVEPFGKWFGKLKDVKAMAAIVRRLRKIEREGYFGDHAPIKGADDLYELRIFVGPGYRVYYGLDGDRIVVILGGSDKGRQADAIA